MSKLKQLKEKRSAVFAQIDELRRATDGRAMSAEEQQRWDTLLEEYSAADREVEAEERFDAIRRRQLETAGQDGPEEEDRDAAGVDGGEGGLLALREAVRAGRGGRGERGGLGAADLTAGLHLHDAALCERGHGGRGAGDGG